MASLMPLRTSTFMAVIWLILLQCPNIIPAWSLSPTLLSSSKRALAQSNPQSTMKPPSFKLIILAASGDDDENNNNKIVDATDDYQPQYGASYIGGDPCGSKYNTDPHDAKAEKPGMPDSMKARIQFLVDQKKREEEKARREEAEESA